RGLRDLECYPGRVELDAIAWLRVEADQLAHRTTFVRERAAEHAHVRRARERDARYGCTFCPVQREGFRRHDSPDLYFLLHMRSLEGSARIRENFHARNRDFRRRFYCRERSRYCGK